MMQEYTNAWESVNDSLNFGYDKWTRQTLEVIHAVNQYLGITPEEEAREAQDRKERLDDMLFLDILDKIIPAGALEFYERLDATRRLIEAGIISKKVHGGWKINRKADPRR